MQRVLLVGLVAAGKSAVLEAATSATGWPGLDDELLLERSSGTSARALLTSGGEAALRSAESDVLTLTLSMPPPLIASVASAAVLEQRDRERLRSGGHVVWLRASVPTLVRRLAKQARPSVPSGDAAVGVLRTMARERDPLYAEVAHQVVDMDVLTPGQAARQVLSAVRH